jgi:hypothetical protein
MKRLLIALSFIICHLSWSVAQTRINADGTVTFQYYNDKAKEVLVDVQFAGRNAMQRDDQ